MGWQHYMTRETAEGTLYDLCAVIVHLDVLGITQFGHYVAYVRNDANKWFAE